MKPASLPQSTEKNMNSSQAQELSHLWCRISGHLDQSVAFVQDNDEENNYLEYRAVVGKLMGDLFCDAMQPLYKRFPELLPDYLGGPHTVPESVYLPPFYDAPHDRTIKEVEQVVDGKPPKAPQPPR